MGKKKKSWQKLIKKSQKNNEIPLRIENHDNSISDESEGKLQEKHLSSEVDDKRSNDCDPNLHRTTTHYQGESKREEPAVLNENLDDSLKDSHNCKEFIPPVGPSTQCTTTFGPDSSITNPGPNEQVAMMTPESSKLNPNAAHFSVTNQERKLDMNLNEENNSNSFQLSTSKNKEGRQDCRKSCSFVKINKQSETAAITDVENKAYEKKKRGKNHFSSNDSYPKQYNKVEILQSHERECANSYSGSVISSGSTLSVDQKLSQNSEISLNNSLSRTHSSHINQNLENYESSSPQGRSSGANESHRKRLARTINDIFQNLSRDGDKEVKKLLVYVESPKAGHFVKVIEEDMDLFSTGEDYSLAHCVAEDMNMGSGIAVEFRRKFKKVEQLLNMRQKSGGLAVLEDNNRYVYYMVTKKISSGKPTYEAFWKSLKKLSNHMKENNVKKLAIPRIGCGLDRLDWNIVKILLEFLFSESDAHILVCNFQQADQFVDGSPNIQRSNKCKIVREIYPINEIEQGTIIVYFASADGYLTPTMKKLDEKFHYISNFKQMQKNLGEVVRFEDRRNNYILCGCIVKENARDLFDFVSFGRCLASIQRSNRKDMFYYVGFQMINDEEDDILNDKVLNCMSHSLRDVDIYCCNCETKASLSFNDSQREN